MTFTILISILIFIVIPILLGKAIAVGMNDDDNT